MADVERFGPALSSAMARVSDLVVIFDAEGMFEYINPFGLELLGHGDDGELIGSSMFDLIHPDDLDRVVTSMARALDPASEVPGRPAVARVRRADGTYVRIEANGSAGDDPGSGSHVVITARPTIEADLHEHLMTLLTAGAPSEKSFEIVPEFGSWRQPNLLHAVFVLDDDGLGLAFGSGALTELGGLDDPNSPWLAPASTGEELFVPVDELDGPSRERALARGITYVRARPVEDALHRSHAVVVMAHDRTSPLPAERSTLEFAWFAIDKMAAVLAMALAWRGQAVELRRAAATDPLTGLANRAGFWSRFKTTSTATAAEVVSVLCIDLDHFKPVNDTYGHSVGDALLMEVSDRLRHIVRPGDLVARLGGDEFTVVVHDLDEAEVSGVADRIVAKLCEPFTVGGHDIRIGASVGVAETTATAFDAESLLDAADQALYRAKNNGRNQWRRASERPAGAD